MSQILSLLKSVSTTQDTFARFHSAYAERLAPDFSPFQFVRTNELGLSKLIGWLLNPRGTHGQKQQFLFLFSEAFSLGWDEAQCSQATVKFEVITEHLKDDRRIDILVAAGRHVLAIENKPWAADQQRQVIDYLHHLRNWTGADKHRLVYLTPTGSAPSEESINKDEYEVRLANGELQLLGYSDLLGWLASCRTACRAERVSAFITGFESYIERTFLGTRDMTERDHIVTEMTSTGASIAAALAIGHSLEAMREKLLTKLAQDVGALVASRGWAAEYKHHSSAGVLWSGISVYYGKGIDVAFRLEFDSKNRASSLYGIKAPKLAPEVVQRVNERLTKFGRGKPNSHWSWRRTPDPQDDFFPTSSDWEASAAPWQAIVDGSLAKAFAASAVRVYPELVGAGALPPPEPNATDS